MKSLVEGRCRDVNVLRLKLLQWTPLVSKLSACMLVLLTTPALIGIAFSANLSMALVISPLLLIAVAAHRSVGQREFIEERPDITQRHTRIG